MRILSFHTKFNAHFTEIPSLPPPPSPPPPPPPSHYQPQQMIHFYLPNISIILICAFVIGWKKSTPKKFIAKESEWNNCKISEKIYRTLKEWVFSLPLSLALQCASHACSHGLDILKRMQPCGLSSLKYSAIEYARIQSHTIASRNWKKWAPIAK